MMGPQQKIIDAFLALELRDEDAWIKRDQKFIDFIIVQIQNFPAFALPSPDAPVAIVGIVHAFGSGVVWMVRGKNFESAVRTVLPLGRQLCCSMYEALGLHRMAMMVDVGRPDAERWAEGLGFEFETVLQRYGERGQNQSVFLWPDERGAS